MLLLGVFIFICALMVAALAIDIGHVHLTRQQMQSAANTAVVEVLRDDDGRADAQRFVRAMFDDDFGMTSDNLINYGAGGKVQFYGGTELAGGFDGSDRFYLPDDPDTPAGGETVGVYKPDIAINSSNDQRGDIVVGSYDYGASNHTEDSSYARSDFEQDPDGSAALVRLRRTGEQGLSRSVGVVGDAVPILFGRGNLSAGNSEYFAFLDRGVRVRATAIADLAPAISAGWAATEHSIIGLSGLAVRKSDVDDSGTDEIDFENPLFFGDDLRRLTVGMTIDEGGSPPEDGIYIAAVVAETSPHLVYGFALVEWTQASETATPLSENPEGIINATGVFVDPSNLSQFGEILQWHQDLQSSAEDWEQLLKTPVRRRSLQ